MKKKKNFRITQDDFLLANRRAAREEEIQAHGKQVIFRPVWQKSKKRYDRKKEKLADIYPKDDFCQFFFKEVACGFFNYYIKDRISPNSSFAS